MKIKKCSKCKEIKNITEFYKNRSECKECKRKYDKIYKKNYAKKLSLIKEIKCSCCNELKENKKFSKGQTICKDCNKLYRVINREKITEWSKEYHEKNKEKISKYNKKYRNDNKEKISIKNKNHKINNIENYLLQYAKSRAKKRNEEFNLTVKDIQNIMPKNNICPLLGIEMEINNNEKKDNSFSLDKINPKEIYNNNNICVISLKANRSKSNAIIEEYEKIINNLCTIKINKDISEKNILIDLKQRIKSYKNRAKKKNIPFNITKEYLELIYPKDNKCPLLGIEFKIIKNKCNDNSPSLDKIIPHKGYTEDNLIWISHKANRIKNNLSIKEMKLLLKNWKKLLQSK